MSGEPYTLLGERCAIEFAAGGDTCAVSIWEGERCTLHAGVHVARARSLAERGRAIAAGALPKQSLDNWIAGIADGIWAFDREGPEGRPVPAEIADRTVEPEGKGDG